jgi:hypothetical protein
MARKTKARQNPNWRPPEEYTKAANARARHTVKATGEGNAQPCRASPGTVQPPTEPHPFALLFPLVEGEQFQALVASMKAQGFLDQFPIYTYQGKVLEGWTRHRAAKEAGVAPIYKEFEGDDAAALAFVCASNSIRRHLTSEQKRTVIANVLKQNPKLSDRQIAGMVGVSHPTVADVRKGLEATGKIYQSKKRKGKDGKERKAQPRKQPKAKPEPQPQPQPQPDPEPLPEPVRDPLDDLMNLAGETLDQPSAYAQKHWSEYSEEDQKFWLTWYKIETKACSPGTTAAEATAFRRKSQEMLVGRGFTRADIPDLIRRRFDAKKPTKHLTEAQRRRRLKKAGTEWVEKIRDLSRDTSLRLRNRNQNQAEAIFWLRDPENHEQRARVLDDIEYIMSQVGSLKSALETPNAPDDTETRADEPKVEQGKPSEFPEMPEFLCREGSKTH